MIEIIIFITGIISVGLAILKDKNTWLVSVINVILLCYVFFKVGLYGNFSLQLFYLIGSFIGYRAWGEKAKFDVVVIIEVAALLIIVSIYLGWKSLIDFSGAILAVVATIFLIQKNTQCFIFYTLSNIAAIYLCLEEGLLMITGQYIIFIALNLLGYFIWRNEKNKIRGIVGSD